MSSDKVGDFMSITGVTDKELAKNMLQACNDNLEMAVNMHMENQGDGGSSSVASGSSSATVSNKTSGAAVDEDEVRAPIPQTRATLIEPGYEGYAMGNRVNPHKARIKTINDGFRNFASETSTNKKSKLNELFKQPLDIMVHKKSNSRKLRHIIMILLFSFQAHGKRFEITRKTRKSGCSSISKTLPNSAARYSTATSGRTRPPRPWSGSISSFGNSTPRATTQSGSGRFTRSRNGLTSPSSTLAPANSWSRGTRCRPWTASSS